MMQCKCVQFFLIFAQPLIRALHSLRPFPLLQLASENTLRTMSSICKSHSAFISTPALFRHYRSLPINSNVAPRMNASPSRDAYTLTRRSLLASILATSLTQLVPERASAAVDIDLDRFGDKGTPYLHHCTTASSTET